MATAMTSAERDSFLTGPWVAVISIPEEGRGPLAVPVWYLYEPGGDICIWTGSSSRKGRLLQKAARISVCIQDMSVPYKYVSAEGPFSLGPVDFERYVKPMAHRYFGMELGEKYLATLGGQAGVADDLLVRLHPEHWLTMDFGKLASGA